MSYDATLPTDKDRIRMLIGDVDSTAELVTDAHIAAIQATEMTVAASAAMLADELLTRFALDPTSFTADGATFSFQARIPQLQAVAARARGATGPFSAVPATYGEAGTPDEFARPSIWRVYW